MADKGGFDLKYVFHPNSLSVVPVEKNTPGELATAGYFEEAAGFLPGEGEVLQLQLLGVTQPATAVGTRVRVQIQGLDEPESWRKLQCFFGKFWFESTIFIKIHWEDVRFFDLFVMFRIFSLG